MQMHCLKDIIIITMIICQEKHSVWTIAYVHSCTSWYPPARFHLFFGMLSFDIVSCQSQSPWVLCWHTHNHVYVSISFCNFLEYIDGMAMNEYMTVMSIGTQPSTPPPSPHPNPKPSHQFDIERSKKINRKLCHSRLWHFVCAIARTSKKYCRSTNKC